MSSNSNHNNEQSIDEILKIAKKAEELLRELVNPNVSNSNGPNKGDETVRAQKSVFDSTAYLNNNNNSNGNHLTITQQPTKLDLNNIINNINQLQQPSQPSIINSTNNSQSYYYQQQNQQQQQYNNPYQTIPTSIHVNIPLPHQVDPNFYATNPPPNLAAASAAVPTTVLQNQFRYPFNNNGYLQTGSANLMYGINQQPLYYQPNYQQQQYLPQYQASRLNGYGGGAAFQQQQRYPLKRKFSDTRYRSYSNEQQISSSNSSMLLTPSTSTTSTSTTNSSINNTLLSTNNDNEDDDLNIMRERELKDLKCKSVVEKMNVFYKYYQQFKELYQQRLQSIECSDSLKMQFHSLVKYLLEYEQILLELNSIIKEHEHEGVCKNNHRKTKKLFNKTKAFIRYECYKRLQSNIFEYRRQINSQDRFAGMYDIIDTNNYLIGLLPDIGVSIRRYINKCEKAKQLEEEEEDLENNMIDDYAAGINDDSDLSNSSLLNNEDGNNNNAEKIISSTLEDDGTLPYTQAHKDSPRSYESFSKGIDCLNRYLLKRVENEESLDELVKERIAKWINKRQSKYILIFSEVDRLLNEHKEGECYSKFHSFLLFNLGKLVTVCDSYHQKLKELLYSTTIRRKKKRKKVKIVPESMSDVFTEINELKRALEHTKFIIKKCNEIKTFPVVS